MNQVLKKKDFFRSSDLALVATLSIFYPIEGVDRQDQNRAYFLFKRNEALDNLIQGYWRGELRMEPQSYFSALRAIKTRIYNK